MASANSSPTSISKPFTFIRSDKQLRQQSDQAFHQFRSATSEDLQTKEYLHNKNYNYLHYQNQVDDKLIKDNSQKVPRSLIEQEFNKATAERDQELKVLSDHAQRQNLQIPQWTEPFIRLISETAKRNDRQIQNLHYQLDDLLSERSSARSSEKQTFMKQQFQQIQKAETNKIISKKNEETQGEPITPKTNTVISVSSSQSKLKKAKSMRLQGIPLTPRTLMLVNKGMQKGQNNTKRTTDTGTQKTDWMFSAVSSNASSRRLIEIPEKQGKEEGEVFSQQKSPGGTTEVGLQKGQEGTQKVLTNTIDKGLDGNINNHQDNGNNCKLMSPVSLPINQTVNECNNNEHSKEDLKGNQNNNNNNQDKNGNLHLSNEQQSYPKNIQNKTTISNQSQNQQFQSTDSVIEQEESTRAKSLHQLSQFQEPLRTSNNEQVPQQQQQEPSNPFSNSLISDWLKHDNLTRPASSPGFYKPQMHIQPEKTPPSKVLVMYPRAYQPVASAQVKGQDYSKVKNTSNTNPGAVSVSVKALTEESNQKQNSFIYPSHQRQSSPSSMVQPNIQNMYFAQNTLLSRKSLQSVHSASYIPTRSQNTLMLDYYRRQYAWSILHDAQTANPNKISEFVALKTLEIQDAFQASKPLLQKKFEAANIKRQDKPRIDSAKKYKHDENVLVQSTKVFQYIQEKGQDKKMENERINDGGGDIHGDLNIQRLHSEYLDFIEESGQQQQQQQKVQYPNSNVVDTVLHHHHGGSKSIGNTVSTIENNKDLIQYPGKEKRQLSSDQLFKEHYAAGYYSAPQQNPKNNNPSYKSLGMIQHSHNNTANNPSRQLKISPQQPYPAQNRAASAYQGSNKPQLTRRLKKYACKFSAVSYQFEKLLNNGQSVE